MFRQLLQFVKADLSSTPKGSPEAEDVDSPYFPKSLRLIHPLSSTFNMNAVEPEAQANVPIPEGLDLENNIVPLSLYNLAPKQPKEKKKRKKGRDLDKVSKGGYAAQ